MTSTAKTGKLSDSVYILKALAILSVAFAHSVRSDAQIQYISDLLGGIGVPIFFICAGLYFNSTEKPSVFWRKKLKNIVVPWLLYSLLTFLVSDRSFTVQGWLLWTIGYGTWLYFVSFLLFYCLLFRIFRQRCMPWLMLGICAISIVLGILGIDIMKVLFKTTYPNPLNRIGYFALGILLREKDWLHRITEKKALLPLSLVLGLTFFALCQFVPKGIIRSTSALFFTFSAIIACYYGAQRLSSTSARNVLMDIGKQTYMIYFLHMQFGNGVSKLLFASWPNTLEWIVLFLFPMVSVMSVYIGILVLGKIMHQFSLQRCKWIIGMR